MTRRSVFADKLNAFSFVFVDEAAATHRGRWQQYFANRRTNALSCVEGGEGRDAATKAKDEADAYPSSLILEIGCYNADFLSQIAERHARLHFIGLDWKARPLYLGAQQIAQRKLPNLALLRARAQELTTLFADGELEEIWLFHPDPFDNERERGMRLMSERFLGDVRRLLRRGGRLILKTDHSEYSETACALVRQAEDLRIEYASGDFWNDRIARDAAGRFAFAGQTTLFEKRFIRRRQPIYYLQIRRD
jgi:tRNA (guanine-N7-)-methyltransferase